MQIGSGRREAPGEGVTPERIGNEFPEHRLCEQYCGSARFLHCYPEEPSRHSSFFKFLNLENLISFSQMLNFAAIEEMDDESPNLVHILPAMDSGSVMSVSGVPDSVDAKPARPQNAPDFAGEVFQFGCSEGHAKEHVRIAPIEMVV